MQYLNTRIKEAMRKKGLTQTDVSDHLGVARSTVWRKLQNQDKWTAGELSILAKYLDTDFAIYR